MSSRPIPQQTRLVLPLPCLRNIRWAAAREDDPVTGYGSLVNAVWREIEYLLDIKLHPTFDVLAYSIPEAQWKQITEWVVELPWGSEIDRATALTDWISRSPSHHPHTTNYPLLEN